MVLTEKFYVTSYFFRSEEIDSYQEALDWGKDQLEKSSSHAGMGIGFKIEKIYRLEKD